MVSIFCGILAICVIPTWSWHIVHPFTDRRLHVSRSSGKVFSGQPLPHSAPRETFGDFMRAIGSAPSGAQARSRLEEMRLAGFEPLAPQYASVIAACNRDGAYFESLAVLAEVRTEGVEPSPSLYAAGLEACAQGGAHSEAWQLLERMREEKSAGLDVSAYTATCKACVKQGRWKRATEVLRCMAFDGVQPQRATAHAVLAACARAGAGEQARALLPALFPGTFSASLLLPASSSATDGSVRSSSGGANSRTDNTRRNNDAGGSSGSSGGVSGIAAIVAAASAGKSVRGGKRAVEMDSLALACVLKAFLGKGSVSLAQLQSPEEQAKAEAPPQKRSGGGGVVETGSRSRRETGGFESLSGVVVVDPYNLSAPPISSSSSSSSSLLPEWRVEGALAVWRQFATTTSTSPGTGTGSGASASAAAAALVVPDLACYRAYLLVCAKGGRVEQAREVLEHMATTMTTNAAAASASSPSASSASSLSSSSTVTTATAGEAHADLGNLSITYNRKTEIQPHPPRNAVDPLSLACAVHACAVAGNANAALELLQTFSSCLMPCDDGSADGRADENLPPLTSRPSHSGELPPPSAEAFTAAMLACVKAGRWKDALGLEAAMARSGVAPTAGTALALVKACRALESGRVLGLLRRMESKGVRVAESTNGVLVRCALVAMCGAGESSGSREEGAVDDALLLLDALQRRRRTYSGLPSTLSLFSSEIFTPPDSTTPTPTPPPQPWLPPLPPTVMEPLVDHATMHSVLRALERKTDWSRALSLILAMSDDHSQRAPSWSLPPVLPPSPDTTSCNLALSACVRGAAPAAWARAVFDGMADSHPHHHRDRTNRNVGGGSSGRASSSNGREQQQQQPLPLPLRDVTTYNLMLRLLLELSRPREALAVRGQLLNAFEAARRKAEQNALRLTNPQQQQPQQPQSEPSAPVPSPASSSRDEVSVIKARQQAEAAAAAAAQAELGHLKELVAARERLRPDNATHNLALHCAKACGDVDCAVSVLEHMFATTAKGTSQAALRPPPQPFPTTPPWPTTTPSWSTPPPPLPQASSLSSLSRQTNTVKESFAAATEAAAAQQKLHTATAAEALELVQESFKPCRPSSLDFAVAVQTCAAADAWDRALGLLSAMQSRGVTPDLRLFTVAIQCFTGSSSSSSAVAAAAVGAFSSPPPPPPPPRWPEVKWLLGLMKSHGVEPDLLVLNMAAATCERAGEWEEAEALLLAMRSQALAHKTTSPTAALPASKGGNLQQPQQKRASRSGGVVWPDLRTYSHVVSVLEAAGQVGKADAVFELALADGVVNLYPPQQQRQQQRQQQSQEQQRQQEQGGQQIGQQPQQQRGGGVGASGKGGDQEQEEEGEEEVGRTQPPKQLKVRAPVVDLHNLSVPMARAALRSALRTHRQHLDELRAENRRRSSLVSARGEDDGFGGGFSDDVSTHRDGGAAGTGEEGEEGEEAGSSTAATTADLTILTGRGLGSVGGVPLLKASIAAMLTEGGGSSGFLGSSVDSDDGGQGGRGGGGGGGSGGEVDANTSSTGGVVVEESPTNPGALIVKGGSNALKRLLAVLDGSVSLAEAANLGAGGLGNGGGT